MLGEEERTRTRMKEHVSNSCGLFVDFKGMARKDNSFGDDSSRIWVQEATHGHKMWG